MSHGKHSREHIYTRNIVCRSYNMFDVRYSELWTIVLPMADPSREELSEF